MSLELAIQENTTALRELLTALQNMPLSTVTVVPGHAATADAPKKETVAVVTRQAKPAETKAETKLELETDVPGVVLQYERDVKPLVLDLAKTTTRQTVIDVLSRFGVARADALQPDQWPQLVEDIQAAKAAFMAAQEAVA